VAGAYATAVDGDITIVFNDGVFSHRIFGGLYTGNKTISGSTSLYINGGTFMNEIYAGNKTDGTISQGTSLTVTGTDAILGKADGDNWDMDAPVRRQQGQRHHQRRHRHHPEGHCRHHRRRFRTQI